MNVWDFYVPVSGGMKMAMTAFVPEDLKPEGVTPVLFLVPGSGANRLWFDMQLSGREGYSQARWMTERGLFVITVDPLGVGESSIPPNAPLGSDYRGMMDKDNPLSREVIEKALHEAVQSVMEQLCKGTLSSEVPALRHPIAIGAGHSAGAHKVAGTQAAYGTFAAIGILGASMTQTKLKCVAGATEPYRAVGPVDWILAALQADGENVAHWPDVDQELRELKDTPWSSATSAAIDTLFMLPFASARQAAEVRVPVIILCGQRDVTADPLMDATLFRSSPDVSVSVIPHMGHAHNYATTRKIAWGRLLQFVRGVAFAYEEGLPEVETVPISLEDFCDKPELLAQIFMNMQK